MFLKELQLNIEYLKEQSQAIRNADPKMIKEIIDFGKQLLSGIAYYRSLKDVSLLKHEFTAALSHYEKEIHDISNDAANRFAA